jgi:putative acetyltransferase
MGALIRRIRSDDNAAVCAIIRSVMTEHGAVGEGYSIVDPEVEAMFEAYQEARCAYFVVEHDGVVVGGSGVAPLLGSEDADVAELKKMYFLPTARGKGWGHQVLAACIEAAREARFHTVYLETLSHMRAARALYERFGFVQQASPSGRTGHSKCDAWYSLRV